VWLVEVPVFRCALRSTHQHEGLLFISITIKFLHLLLEPGDALDKFNGQRHLPVKIVISDSTSFKLRNHPFKPRGRSPAARQL
jgi:hypothetical protein